VTATIGAQAAGRPRTADQDPPDHRGPQVAGGPPVPDDARRTRDFGLLWAGQTLSKVGGAVTSVAVALVAVDALQASSAEMGVLRAASWLPWLAIGLVAGAWTDRMRRMPVMLWSQLISFVLFLSLPLAAWAGTLTMGQLLVVTLVVGVAQVFFSAAYSPYLPTLLPARDLPKANGRLATTEQIAMVSGPGLGGLIVQGLGAVTGLMAQSLGFLASVLCLRAIRTVEPPVTRPERRTRLRDDVRDGLTYVVRDPYLRVLAACSAVDNLVLSGAQALLVIFLVREVGVGAVEVGLLIGADALGGVLGAVVAARIIRRYGTARALLGSAFVTAPFGLLIPLTTPGWGVALFVVGLLVPSIGIVVGNVVVSTFRQSYPPTHLRGRVFTSSRFVAYGVIPIGALLGGWLGEVVGLRAAMWALFAAVALSKLLRLIGPIKNARDLPAASADPDGPAGGGQERHTDGGAAPTSTAAGATDRPSRPNPRPGSTAGTTRA